MYPVYLLLKGLDHPVYPNLYPFPFKYFMSKRQWNQCKANFPKAEVSDVFVSYLKSPHQSGMLKILQQNLRNSDPLKKEDFHNSSFF